MAGVICTPNMFHGVMVDSIVECEGYVTGIVELNNHYIHISVHDAAHIEVYNKNNELITEKHCKKYEILKWYDKIENIIDFKSRLIKEGYLEEVE